MAEDLTETKEPMDFHPCDTPRGMLYYNMDILTNEQQRKLNALKIETIRDNQKYLAEHPEIRACVAIMSRLVLRQKPRSNIHETIAEYFAKSRVDIEAEIDEYVNNRHRYVYEAAGNLNLYSDMSFESLSEEEDERQNLFKYVSSESMGLDRSFGSVVKITSPCQESEDFPDIDTSMLQLELPDSLKNIGVNYKEIKKVSSNAIVNSISVITQTAEEETEEDGVDKVYTGHIPTIEDYDAGYGRQQQIFESSQSSLEMVKVPVIQHKVEMKQHDTNVPSEEPQVHITSVEEPKSESVSNIENKTSEITPLMEAKSLRMSRVPDEMDALKSEDEKEENEEKSGLVTPTKDIKGVDSQGGSYANLKRKTSSGTDSAQIHKLHLNDVSERISSKIIDDTPKISKSDIKRANSKGESSDQNIISEIKLSEGQDIELTNKGENAQKSDTGMARIPRKSSLKNVHTRQNIGVSKSRTQYNGNESEVEIDTNNKIGRRISFGAVVSRKTDKKTDSNTVIDDSAQPQIQNNLEEVVTSKTVIEDVPQE